MAGLLDRLAVLAASDALPVKARVLLSLVCHADKDGRSWPSTSGIARRIGSTQRVVRKVLEQLAEAELVECEQRGKGGRSRGMTVWRVAPGASEDSWQSFVAGESGEKGGPDRTPIDPERGSPQDRKEGPPGASFGAERGSKIDERGSPQDRKGGPPRTPEPIRNPVQPNGGSLARRDGATSSPQKQMLDRLAELGLRFGGNLFKVNALLLQAIEDGLVLDDLEDLVAEAQTGRNPPGLFLSLIETAGTWRNVLLDAECRAKESGLRRRVVDGVGSEPKMASSVDGVIPMHHAGGA